MHGELDVIVEFVPGPSLHFVLEPLKRKNEYVGIMLNEGLLNHSDPGPQLLTLNLIIKRLTPKEVNQRLFQIPLALNIKRNIIKVFHLMLNKPIIINEIS
jgi:hypothetical protein